ncbi:chalcone reductase [Senna tora]|uniref:Chalcone reductase n=1 Tax=Senna tora TaxID=362788 RepID=A0A835CAF8_9FABA|nr:chalcone reductase [Senna tora]
MEDVMPLDLKGVWAAMEECQRLGLTRAIGVSNFSVKKLQNLLSFTTIAPAVNQVEMNAAWQQKELVRFCKEKGIAVTAFSPLRKGGSRGPNEAMENDVVKEIAEERGKSAAQVCLRWLYEEGVTFVPKSYNKERMTQNLQIFDWSLKEEDHKKISQINQHRLLPGPTKPQIPDLYD